MEPNFKECPECEECGGSGEVPDLAKLKGLYDAEVKAGIYDPKNPTETLTEKLEKGYNFKRHGIEYDQQ